MAERAVSIIYTHIYALLRNTTFFSLEELNHALLQHLTALNNKPYKNGIYRRLYLFQAQEQTALKALPPAAFECFYFFSVGLSIFFIIMFFNFSCIFHLLKYDSDNRTFS
jgi:hypothetical protein